MSENTPRGTIGMVLMAASESVAALDPTEVLGVNTVDIKQRMRTLVAEYLDEGQERPHGLELREIAGG